MCTVFLWTIPLRAILIWGRSRRPITGSAQTEAAWTTTISVESHNASCPGIPSSPPGRRNAPTPPSSSPPQRRTHAAPPGENGPRSPEAFSIGVPIAVSTDYSYIVPTGTMVIHPVRMNGMVIGVPQTFEYFGQEPSFRMSNRESGQTALRPMALKNCLLLPCIFSLSCSDHGDPSGAHERHGDWSAPDF